MGNQEYVVDYLIDNKIKNFCDDCLSIELEIFPRQQVNQICNKLKTQQTIERGKAICSSCGKSKIVNGITVKQSFEKVQKDEKSSFVPSLTNINDYLRAFYLQIVPLCEGIWNENRPEEIRPTPIPMINILRKEGFLPSHIANMMLTLCSLRNTFEHQNIKFGAEEKIIAENAWKIIEKWKLEK